MITCTYNPLYLLTNASYCTGEQFSYSNDPVGNRLTQQTLLESSPNTYEAASRLSSVDGVTYTWDANVNLLSDGVSTYIYYKANHLKSITNSSS